MAAVRWEGININLTLSLFCFQIQCIDYGQRQAKVSVVATAALKHHVSTLGGQRWDTLTHPLVWMEFGRPRCDLGDKSGALILRKQDHVNGGSLMNDIVGFLLVLKPLVGWCSLTCHTLWWKVMKLDTFSFIFLLQ